ncbi:MAG: hypothetical protein U1G07_02740 [Verrucomicrobiota bacterium]
MVSISVAIRENVFGALTFGIGQPGSRGGIRITRSEVLLIDGQIAAGTVLARDLSSALAAELDAFRRRSPQRSSAGTHGPIP